MSKRRTRPGGVMARAIMRRPDKRRAHAVVGKGLPLGLAGGERSFLADQQAGLLIGLPDRRKRDGAGARMAGAAGAGGELCLLMRVQTRRHGDAAVGRIGAAAGKHELPGHEGVPHVAAAHQHVELAALAVEQDQRAGVARAQRPWPSAFASSLSTSALVMPSMRRPYGVSGAMERVRIEPGLAGLHSSGCVSMRSSSPPKPCM